MRCFPVPFIGKGQNWQEGVFDWRFASGSGQWASSGQCPSEGLHAVQAGETQNSSVLVCAAIEEGRV
jgi:hypothetical protein